MRVQVKPPPPSAPPRSIPLGFFSGVALLIIFGWVWSEAFLLIPNSWISFFLGLAGAAVAYFIAFRKWPLPRIVQALAFGLIAAIATFRIIVIHETSDADALGGVFCGLMVFVLVAMDQNQLKEY